MADESMRWRVTLCNHVEDDWDTDLEAVLDEAGALLSLGVEYVVIQREHTPTLEVSQRAKVA